MQESESYKFGQAFACGKSLDQLYQFNFAEGMRKVQDKARSQAIPKDFIAGVLSVVEAVDWAAVPRFPR